MAPPQISERFCAPDADITIASSDGVLFKVHRKNLEVHSDIFADAENATHGDDVDAVVPLSETAAVLELLFQYMHRQLPPNLHDVDFTTCAGVAEAAEKYWVYSALNICRMKMKESVKQYPLQVLEYAVRHDHADLAAEAARQSMGLDVLAAMESLSPDTFKAWISFREQWHKGARALLAACVKGFRYKTNDAVLWTLAECIQDANPCYNMRSQVEDIITHSADYTQREALRKLLESRFGDN
ncbi:hypothetical protein B0H17DRAFT_1101435 [Mycena rosella]|uniref:BTB domain-containing protein n=1 Tax=Mycena rosella TaxID=1033263 RepID=A0AAD7G2G6_MYCRO|nr:hypothetical protein B0H17DRAFT_1101435 [Mycena rosella]